MERWNADVLDLIIAHLERTDVPSVALASSRFMACANRRLYSTLLFDFSMARRYPEVRTAFSTVARHPELAVHVQSIDIRTIPFAGMRFSAVFLQEVDDALAMCDNLVSFRCSANALPAFIDSLRQKPQLWNLRVNVATFPRARCVELLDISGLVELCLDWAPVLVATILPSWARVLRSTLRSLTLFMSPTVNEEHLRAVLEQVPELGSLHVIGCPLLYHDAILGLTSLVPALKRLSMSVKPDVLDDPNRPALELTNLRYLTIDVRATQAARGGDPELAANVVAGILHRIAKGPHPPTVKSLRIRTPGQTIMYPILLSQLTSSLPPTGTLEEVAFLDCGFGSATVFASFCATCSWLEVLEMKIPIPVLDSFVLCIAASRFLRMLRSSEQSLSKAEVARIFEHSQSLQEIQTKGGRWLRGSAAPRFQHLPGTDALALDNHWFIPVG